MDDTTLDRLVASTGKVTGRDVDRLDLAASEADLLEAIMSIETTCSTTAAITEPRPRRVLRLLSVAAVVVALVGMVGYRSARPGQRVAFSTELIAVAERAPRVLLQAPGWSVSGADELSASNGEMTFTNGKHDLELRWLPAADARLVADDRAASADRAVAVSVLGHPATMFRYAGTTSYTTIWSDGVHALEARGADFGAEDEYRSVLLRLRVVDSEAWLLAMPPTVLKPAEIAASIDSMLNDVPQAEGFRVEVPNPTVHDRYQLGAAVTAQVACRWLGDWVAATASGDQVAAEQAVDAMASSHHWAILQEMKGRGDFPQVLWQYADAMAGDGTIMAGSQLSVRDSYKAALGCV